MKESCVQCLFLLAVVVTSVALVQSIFVANATEIENLIVDSCHEACGPFDDFLTRERNVTCTSWCSWAQEPILINTIVPWVQELMNSCDEWRSLSYNNAMHEATKNTIFDDTPTEVVSALYLDRLKLWVQRIDRNWTIPCS